MARPDQLSRIKDLVEEGNLDQAREEALGFIQYDLPEGREIHLVQTAGGQKIPAIQLPHKVGHVQLPLLYVGKGPHGLHLYGGEDFSEGQFLTSYDGKFVADSVEEVELVLKGSLGCMSNHAVEGSNVATFVFQDWISPISEHTESCWLGARKPGQKHLEITTNYAADPTISAIQQPLKAAKINSETGNIKKMNPNNIWSLQFCRDVFGMTGKAADTWEKSEVRFGRSAAVGLSAEVTRKIGPQHGLDIDPISFLVESSSEESGNSRYFFIKFNEDHGASIVDVLQVIRPRAMEAGQSYNRTMQYRQICSTPEALQCTDKEADDPSIGLLGRSGLRTLLERRHELYHSGDVVQFGDIRTLIGVIKWYPETFENEHKLSRGYFRNYPRADVIRVGAHFSQTRGAGGP